MSGTYTVSITDNIGCSSSATVAMLVNPLPEAQITSAKSSGCVPFCTTFTAQAGTVLQSNVFDFGNGVVTSGSSSGTCYNTSGTFTINSMYTDVNGCSNKSTYTIEAYPLPISDFNFAPQKPVVNEDVYFTDASYNGNLTSWSWNFSHMTNSVITQQNPQLVYTEAGSYVAALIVTTDKGCRDTITKSIFVGEDYGLYVPNAFTPNGDGINDIFYPKGFGIVTYELNIFDRWGERIFTTRNFAEGWAGNYQGRNDESVPLGVYVWHITLKNVYGKIEELTGKVLVER
jgi:gliding motility-associated-like protein